MAFKLMAHEVCGRDLRRRDADNRSSTKASFLNPGLDRSDDSITHTNLASLS